MAYLASDHFTPATCCTIAVTVAKNGNTFGNLNAGATNGTEMGSGLYKITVDATDTATIGPFDVKGTCSLIDTVIKQCWVEETASSAPTIGAIACAVWDETHANHFTAGSTGCGLLIAMAVPTVSVPTIGAIACAVWDETHANHFTAGSTGCALLA